MDGFKIFLGIVGFLSIATLVGVAVFDNIDTYSYLYGIVMGILLSIVATILTD